MRSIFRKPRSRELYHAGEQEQLVGGSSIVSPFDQLAGLPLLSVRPLLRCSAAASHPLCTAKEPPDDEERERELAKIAENASIDDPPTMCCRSGCPNCVYVVWAEALSSKMAASGPEVVDKIMQLVDDPSMKAYLEMELRLRGLKK